MLHIYVLYLYSVIITGSYNASYLCFVHYSIIYSIQSFIIDNRSYTMFDNTKHRKLEILQSLGGLYDGLAFYALHWSYAPSL